MYSRKSIDHEPETAQLRRGAESALTIGRGCMEETISEPNVQLRALSPSDWPAIERLFGPTGIGGGCWCMWWRRKGGKTWQSCKGEPNRADFQALVKSGNVHGIIACAGDEPVGWCNIG